MVSHYKNLKKLRELQIRTNSLRRPRKADKVEQLPGQYDVRAKKTEGPSYSMGKRLTKPIKTYYSN